MNVEGDSELLTNGFTIHDNYRVETWEPGTGSNSLNKILIVNSTSPVSTGVTSASLDEVTSYLEFREGAFGEPKPEPGQGTYISFNTTGDSVVAVVAKGAEYSGSGKLYLKEGDEEPKKADVDASGNASLILFDVDAKAKCKLYADEGVRLYYIKVMPKSTKESWDFTDEKILGVFQDIVEGKKEVYIDGLYVDLTKSESNSLNRVKNGGCEFNGIMYVPIREGKTLYLNCSIVGDISVNQKDYSGDGNIVIGAEEAKKDSNKAGYVTIKSNRLGTIFNKISWLIPTEVDAPTAKTNIIYTGTEQEGVEKGAGYTLYTTNYYNGDVPSPIKATSVGKYHDLAKLNEGYIWSDGTTEDKIIDWEIGKAPLTVTANDKTITYGDEPADNGVDYSGFVNGENEDVLGGALSYEYDYNQNDKVGQYSITPGGLTSDNYDIKFVDGKLNVEKANSITGAPIASKSVDYTVDTVGKVTLPANWTWKMEDINKELTVGASVEAIAEYTGSDKDNYADTAKYVTVLITRNACTHDNLEDKSEVPASCIKEGILAHSKCPVCNKLFVKDNDKLVEKTADELKIEAVGHSYGKATYSWSEDHSTCTATKVCVREGCDENSEDHVVTETVKTTSKTTPAGCEEKGVITYTATFTDKDFGTATDSVDIAAKNHDYVITYEWSEDGKTCTAIATCSNDNTHKITEAAQYEADKETSKIKAAVKEAATTEKMGTTAYTATFDNKLFTAQTKDVVDIPKVENPAENPSENPSENPAETPGENPSENPAENPSENPSENPAETPATPVDNKTTTVVKEEGTTIPVADNKAEVVVTSKPGEEPSVAYKGTTDESAKVIEIPETVVSNGVAYAVTEISEGAFENNKSVESVKLGDNITTLGENAFAGCTNLKSVELSKNIKELPEGIFKDCTSLKEVDIPKNVKKIGDKSFSGCSKLATMNLKNNVTEIGEKAFEGCTSLKKVTLGKNVTKIGSKAFNGAKKLKIITIQSKKFTKKSVKGAFKGSKINTIKVDTGSKALNKKLVKKYKKIFTKKNIGRKVTIK